MPDAPNSGTSRESQANQGRDRVGIVEGTVSYGPVGSVFGENSFYRETWGTRRGGSPCC